MNESLKKKLIEYTAENAFVQACGIEIWELEEDHAVMGTAARPELAQPHGNAARRPAVYAGGTAAAALPPGPMAALM